MKRFLLILLAVGLALVGCTAGENAEEAHADEQEVSVTALDELRYEPSTIEVEANRPVALTLINEGALDHDLSIVQLPLAGEVEAHAEEEAHDEHEMSMDEDELALHLSATPDDRETVIFTPSEPGEYQFLCTVPGHQEAGMVGTLVVTAP